MSVFSIAERIAGCLDEDHLDYAIGGALALSVWALPRDTSDVDLSIFARSDELARVFDALERAGVMIDRSDATKAQARIRMFTCRAGKTLVDVFIGEHPHFAEMHRNRQQVKSPTSDLMLWFISADDLCVTKLMFGRAKDVPDLEHLFARKPSPNVDYIRSWLTKILPAGDRRLALLDDLERRFLATDD